MIVTPETPKAGELQTPRPRLGRPRELEAARAVTNTAGIVYHLNPCNARASHQKEVAQNVSEAQDYRG